MFRKMRRQDREITNAESITILENCSYGILSTINKNGYPYGVPVNYVYINQAIYFHSALEGSKLDNIRENSKVAFCVVGETCVLPEKFSTEYESVILFGTAIEVFDEEKNAALLAFVNKYSANYIEEGKAYIKNASEKTKVVKIHIEHISAKARR